MMNINWIKGNKTENEAIGNEPYYLQKADGTPYDTSVMSQEEFTEIRKPEIRGDRVGGSDIAVLLGLSPFKSSTELANELSGITPVEKEVKNEAILQAGHDAEEFVAQKFVSYMRRYEHTEFEIINDARIFRNKALPHAQANLDRRIVKINGKKCDAILECKTTNFRNMHTITEYWQKGICPPYYECQVRWYMMTMNVKVAYIVCCWGLQDSEMAVIKIEDSEEQNRIIANAVDDFFDCIEQGIIPDETNPNSELYNNCWLRYNGAPKPEVLPVEFPPTVLEAVKRASEINEEIEAAKKKVDELKSIQQDILKVLLPLYGGADYGSVAEDNEETGMRSIYGVSLKPHFKRAKFDEDRFRMERPDLWDAYKKEVLDLTELGKKEKKTKAEYTLPAEIDTEKPMDFKVSIKTIPIPAN